MSATEADTAIIIADMDWLNPYDWLISPYSYNFKDFFKYLKLKNIKYAVFTNNSLKKIDRILYNKKYRNIHLFGHGSRHAFILNKKSTVYYCRYSNKKIRKDFIAQWHCNHGGGDSLAKYIVPNLQKRKRCYIGNAHRFLFEVNRQIKKMRKEAQISKKR